MEHALLRLEKQTVLEEASQDPTDMLLMFVERAGKYQDVVKIYNHEPVQHVAEDVIHQGLEDSRGVGESKGHHQILEVAEMGVEGGLPLVALTDSYQVVVAQVELDENRGVR